MNSFEELEKVWLACSKDDSWEDLLGDTINNVALQLASMLMKAGAPITPDNIIDVRTATVWATRYVLESAYLAHNCTIEDESILVMALGFFGDIVSTRRKSPEDLQQLVDHGDTVASYVQQTKTPVKDSGMTPPRRRSSSSPTFFTSLTQAVKSQPKKPPFDNKFLNPLMLVVRR